MDEVELDVVGEGGGDAVDIEFVCMAPLGLEEDLVAFFFGEFDNLVFDRRAVAGARAGDFSGVHGGFVEVAADNVVGFRGCPGDVAGNLFHVERSIGCGMLSCCIGVTDKMTIEGVDVVVGFAEGIGKVREKGGRGVTVLELGFREVDGTAVEATRGAGFEAFDLKAEAVEGIGDSGGGIAHAAAFFIFEADVHESAHECAGGEDNGTGVDLHLQGGGDACYVVVFNEELGDVGLMEIDTRSGFESMFDAELVGFFIALSARSADRGSFAGVEHAKLDAGCIGVEAHGTSESVDLADHVALGKPTDGGVARHGADSVEVLSEDGDTATEPGCGEGGFDPGMAGSDDENVVVFWIGEHGGSCGVGRCVSQEVWEGLKCAKDTDTRGSLDGRLRIVPRGTICGRKVSSRGKVSFPSRARKGICGGFWRIG